MTCLSASEVISLIQQYLKEANLVHALRALESETGHAYNQMDKDDHKNLVQSILNGDWDKVLTLVKSVQLPVSVNAQLYEQVILEMLLLKEFSMTKALLRQCCLREYNATRYLELERLMSQAPNVTEQELFPAGSKHHQRQRLADNLASVIQVVEPSQLLGMLGESIQWRKQHVSSQAKSGLSCSVPESLESESDHGKNALLGTKCHSFKFPKSQRVCCIAFGHEHYMALGFVDGLVEVWDTLQGCLCVELPYQKDEAFIVMESSIVCVDFDSKGLKLLTGCVQGTIGIWEVASGNLLVELRSTYNETSRLTSAKFIESDTQILTCGFDGTLKIIGLNSASILKSFVGHTSFVNDAVLLPGLDVVVSASSDNTLKFWNSRSSACLHTIYLKNGQVASASDLCPAVTQLVLLPGSSSRILVCNKSPHLYILSSEGKLLQSFCSSSFRGVSFVAIACSLSGEIAYAAASNGFVCCFSMATGDELFTFKASDADVLGIFANSRHGVMAVFDDAGEIGIWE